MSSQPPVAESPLFFLDYDGTLAPIVDDPLKAYPHPDVPDLLRALDALHPVYIVTGRHLRDLNRFLPDADLPAIGLHGAQTGVIGGEASDRLTEVDREQLHDMRSTVPDGEGIAVEDKGYTFAVHYRHAPDSEKAKKRIRQWASDAPERLSAIWGKAVVELRPEHLHKGSAVMEIAREYPDKRPVYIGDDVTDEDAFDALGEDAITIKVGDGSTDAAYRLPDVGAVVKYLKRYL